MINPKPLARESDLHLPVLNLKYKLLQIPHGHTKTKINNSMRLEQKALLTERRPSLNCGRVQRPPLECSEMNETDDKRNLQYFLIYSSTA